MSTYSPTVTKQRKNVALLSKLCMPIDLDKGSKAERIEATGVAVTPSGRCIVHHPSQQELRKTRRGGTERSRHVYSRWKQQSAARVTNSSRVVNYRPVCSLRDKEDLEYRIPFEVERFYQALQRHPASHVEYITTTRKGLGQSLTTCNVRIQIECPGNHRIHSSQSALLLRVCLTATDETAGSIQVSKRDDGIPATKTEESL